MGDETESEATPALPAKTTEEAPSRQPLANTPVLAPTYTAEVPETITPSPEATNTALAAPTDRPMVAATITPTIAPRGSAPHPLERADRCRADRTQHADQQASTVRDATYVLDEILNNETDLTLLEHTTDTAGYTDL